MVRLQHIFARKVKGKSYHKWQVTLPPKVVEDAGWKEGMELEAEHRGGRVTLRPAEPQPDGKRRRSK